MKNENFKVPIILGITGHRDIGQIHYTKLKERLIEIYKSVIGKYSNTPIILLSPLADGADRIAVEVALSEEFKNKITISVPLPFDEENYKETFGKGLKVNLSTSKESIEKFKVLLDQINKQNNDYIPKIIPMIFDKELYKSSTDDEKKVIRRKQYSRVGEYIALHSNILIAIYDENSEEKEGGTKEIVRKKLTGDYDYFSVIAEDVTYPEDGIVYTIDTPKANEKKQTDYQIKKIFPNGTEVIGLKTDKKQINNIINEIKDFFCKPCIKTNLKDSYNLYTQHHKRIECFNKDVNLHSKAIYEKYEKDKLDEINYDMKLFNKNIMIRRSAAFLSSAYQSKMKLYEKWILLLIIITILFIMLKSNFQNIQYTLYMDVIYIVFIGIFFILYMRFKGHKEKHEDYRSLSESLRVQIAWNMVNINDSVALYYLSHQKDELDWIRTAIRGINIFYSPKDEHKDIDFRIVNKYWIDSQINYFTNGLQRYKEKEDYLFNNIELTFGMFILYEIVFFILELKLDINNFPSVFMNLNSLDIGKLLLTGLPLTMITYLKSKQLFDANNEILREYKLSLNIFKRAKNLLKNKSKNKQCIYKNIGIEALRENSSWIITRRTKEYNIPS